MKNAPSSSCSVSVGRMLNLLSRRLNSDMETRLKELGLSLNGFFVLMTLMQSEGITQSELGKRLSLPPYGISRLIDSLHAINLVERRDDPTSRRNHLVFLMDHGRAIAPEIQAVINQVNETLLAGLSASERQAFTATLAKLV